MAASLYQLVATSQVGDVRNLLQEGTNINGEPFLEDNRLEETPLHVFIKNYPAGRAWDPMLDLFSELKVKVNYQTTQGETPLHYAVVVQSPMLVKWCLLNGADPWIRNNEGEVPVEAAVKQAARAKGIENVNTVIAEALQAWIANMESATEMRALATAWREIDDNNRLLARQALFKRAEQALLSTTNDDVATRNVASIIRTNDLPLDFCLKDRRTLLMVAANRGHVSTVRWLVSAGANVDATDEAGRTALHFTVHRGSAANHVMSTKELVGAGANPTIRDDLSMVGVTNSSRRTALRLAMDVSNANPSVGLNEIISALKAAQTSWKKMQRAQRQGIPRLRQVGGLARGGGALPRIDSPRKGRTRGPPNQPNAPLPRIGQHEDPLYTERSFRNAQGETIIDEYMHEQTPYEHMMEKIEKDDVKALYKVGMPVTVLPSRRGGDMKEGVIKYVGHTHFANGVWIGVALTQRGGNHNGMADGKRYFQAPAGFGIFVRPERVVAASHDE